MVVSRRSANVIGAVLLLVCLGTPLAGQSGPDLYVLDMGSPIRWGSVGGISGYSFSTTACNAGDMPVSWIADTNQHPVLGQQLYRLENGRFEQIGMSWLFHEFCALNLSMCGTCQSTNCASLGIGCSDSSSSSIMGQQSSLGPRSEVDPYTGEFVYPFTAIGQTGDAIYKRLQVSNADLDPAQHPGALYFAEQLFITPDEAPFGTQGNDYSYRPVAVGPMIGGGFDLALDPGSLTIAESPAITAWQSSDPEVVIAEIDVPGDGSLFLAYRATDLGGGQFHYEFAFFNANSARGARSFAVPVPAGVSVTNVGFHDVAYHSGESFDGTDWTADLTNGFLTWSTPTYAQDPNANALRWSTTYNFRFDAGAPPVTRDLQAGLFAPGTPDQLVIEAIGPAGAIGTEFRRGDCNADGSFDIGDPIALLGYLFIAGAADPTCHDACDANDDGLLNIGDAVYALASQFSGGALPPAPYDSCGQDPTPDATDCMSFAACP